MPHSGHTCWVCGDCENHHSSRAHTWRDLPREVDWTCYDAIKKERGSEWGRQELKYHLAEQGRAKEDMGLEGYELKGRVPTHIVRQDEHGHDGQQEQREAHGNRGARSFMDNGFEGGKRQGPGYRHVPTQGCGNRNLQDPVTRPQPRHESRNEHDGGFGTAREQSPRQEERARAQHVPRGYSPRRRHGAREARHGPAPASDTNDFFFSVISDHEAPRRGAAGGGCAQRPAQDPEGEKFYRRHYRHYSIWNWDNGHNLDDMADAIDDFGYGRHRRPHRPRQATDSAIPRRRASRDEPPETRRPERRGTDRQDHARDDHHRRGQPRETPRPERRGTDSQDHARDDHHRREQPRETPRPERGAGDRHKDPHNDHRRREEPRPTPRRAETAREPPKPRPQPRPPQPPPPPPPAEETLPDYYEVLGVKETATVEECLKAAKKKLIMLHPDRHAEDKDDPVKMKYWTDESAKVSEAKLVLGDNEQKKEYDTKRWLEQGRKRRREHAGR